jgi:hypothetical protein
MSDTDPSGKEKKEKPLKNTKGGDPGGDGQAGGGSKSGMPTISS